MKNTDMIMKRGAVVLALLLGSSTWLSAEPGDQNKTTETSGSGTQVMKINKASALIGAEVKNQQGEKLGKIHDIVIDFNSDKVGYVVLDSSGGVLKPAKLHAVPLRAFQPDSMGTGLILNADKEKLANSEGFDKNNWPAPNSGASAWGAQPFWKDSQTPSSSETPAVPSAPNTKENR